jgi:hypothetical protein
MTQRIQPFIVVLLLMFSVTLFGQQESRNYLHLKDIKTVVNKPLTNYLFLNKQPITMQENLPQINSIVTPGNFSSEYMNRLGFFCQKELQLEKLTNIPFRFRLGSLDYVNYLEQKPNVLKPF